MLLKCSVFCVLNRPTHTTSLVLTLGVQNLTIEDRNNKDVVSVHNLYKQYFYFEQQNND